MERAEARFHFLFNFGKARFLENVSQVPDQPAPHLHPGTPGQPWGLKTGSGGEAGDGVAHPSPVTRVRESARSAGQRGPAPRTLAWWSETGLALPDASHQVGMGPPVGPTEDGCPQGVWPASCLWLCPAARLLFLCLPRAWHPPSGQSWVAFLSPLQRARSCCCRSSPRPSPDPASQQIASGQGGRTFSHNPSALLKPNGTGRGRVIPLYDPGHRPRGGRHRYFEEH